MVVATATQLITMYLVCTGIALFLIFFYVIRNKGFGKLLGGFGVLGIAFGMDVLNRTVTGGDNMLFFPMIIVAIAGLFLIADHVFNLTGKW